MLCYFILLLHYMSEGNIVLFMYLYTVFIYIYIELKIQIHEIKTFFLLHYIYFTAVVTLQIKILYTKHDHFIEYCALLPFKLHFSI